MGMFSRDEQDDEPESLNDARVRRYAEEGCTFSVGTARAARDRDAIIKRLDSCLADATDKLCRRAGGIHADPSPQDVRDIFASAGLLFVLVGETKKMEP